MQRKISKSPEILQKEAKIKTLQGQLKKRQSVLKSLKTRLTNTKEEIAEIQRKASGMMLSKMEKLDQLREEIANLTRELKKIKGFSREEKQELTSLADALDAESLFGDNYDEFEAYKSAKESGEFDFEENHRAKMHDIYAEFQVKPNEVEQRNIRKVFIKLSQKFHPDKATTKAEAEEFHSVMQKINEAYSSGDIQTLLELEQLFLMEQLDLTESKAYDTDVLDNAINRLERDLQFIENQVNRNRAEIKNLRNSELGTMLTQLKKAAKVGEGLDDMMAHLDQGIEMLTKIRDGFKDSIKRKALSPNLIELMEKQTNPFFAGEGVGMQDFMEMMQEQGADVEDLMDLFGFEMEEPELEPIKRPKFKLGSSVKVSINVHHPTFSSFNMQDLEGRVVDAYYTPDRLKVYEVEWDSISLKKLPVELIQTFIDDDISFKSFHIYEHQLAKSKSRDELVDTTTTFRLLFHQYNWEYLPKKVERRLQKILLAKPELSDMDNWKLYFDENLVLPFKAKTRGNLEFEYGEKMSVERLAGYNQDVGFIMDVKLGKERGTYPLMDLAAHSKRVANYQLLEDYEEWCDDIHGDYFHNL